MTSNTPAPMPPSNAALFSDSLAFVKSFLSSNSRFRIFHIFHTLPIDAPPRHPHPQTVYILDSSFNPPTRAHASLITSALRTSPAPVLLLFSTHNADKGAAFPATDYAHRLAMMHRFAAALAPASVDIALTSHPFYADKSAAIDDSDVYGSPPPHHIHLVGHDTFVRILTPRYYEPDGWRPPLSALDGFFARHGLRVTLRASAEAEAERERERELDGQRELWRRLQRGGMESDGGKREWAGKIEVVDAEPEGVGISSTRVREACRMGRWDEVHDLLGKEVTDWIREMKLYQDRGE